MWDINVAIHNPANIHTCGMPRGKRTTPWLDSRMRVSEAAPTIRSSRGNPNNQGTSHSCGRQNTRNTNKLVRKNVMPPRLPECSA